MTQIGFWPTVRREIGRMASRKMYLGFMIVVPVAFALFFVSLLSAGLPSRIPVAMVDLDHSKISRGITRSMDANQLLDIKYDLESYSDAMTEIRKGNIFGFVVIPPDFEKDITAGKHPSIEYYNSLTYFVPGTIAFKGMKTIMVTTAAGVILGEVSAMGVPASMSSQLLQPISVQEHDIGNPWLNYSYYLSPSFMIGALALFILLMCVFSITMEIKNGTSPGWLSTAKGHIGVAICGKLFPHFVVWSVVGQFYLALMFGYLHFPCGNIWALMLGMELFILANQFFAVLVCSALPNPRLAFSVVALLGILSFSFLGFSFPVQNMYGAFAILSYLMPARYLYLIYIFCGLDAFPIYYSRIYFAALIAFPLVGCLLLKRLKKALLNPIYVP